MTNQTTPPDDRPSAMSGQPGDGGTGRPKRVILAYSQSNFRSISDHDWSPPPNFHLFDGGLDGQIGSCFIPCPGDRISVPWAIVGHLAACDPGTDYYLLVCAAGGVGVRSVVGMPYLWSSVLSGDPGPGVIGFDTATPDKISEVRYSTLDADGLLRFTGQQDLSVTARTAMPARLEIAGETAGQLVFDLRGPGVARTGHVRQGARIVGASNWPPVDGSRVILYPAQQNLGDVIRRNSNAAFDALGLTGRDRVYQQLLLWPTESEVSYAAAYSAVDHHRLMAFLADWTDEATQSVYTLPWPHHPKRSSARNIGLWWTEIEAIVRQDHARRLLVSLEGTAKTDWGDIDNIHVGDGASKARIGLLIAQGALLGGIPRRHRPSWPSRCWTAAWSRLRPVLGRMKRGLLSMR